MKDEHIETLLKFFGSRLKSDVKKGILLCNKNNYTVKDLIEINKCQSGRYIDNISKLLSEKEYINADDCLAFINCIELFYKEAYKKKQWYSGTYGLDPSDGEPIKKRLVYLCKDYKMFFDVFVKELYKLRQRYINNSIDPYLRALYYLYLYVLCELLESDGFAIQKRKETIINCLHAHKVFKSIDLLKSFNVENRYLLQLLKMSNNDIKKQNYIINLNENNYNIEFLLKENDYDDFTLKYITFVEYLPKKEKYKLKNTSLNTKIKNIILNDMREVELCLKTNKNYNEINKNVVKRLVDLSYVILKIHNLYSRVVINVHSIFKEYNNSHDLMMFKIIIKSIIKIIDDDDDASLYIDALDIFHIMKYDSNNNEQYNFVEFINNDYFILDSNNKIVESNLKNVLKNGFFDSDFSDKWHILSDILNSTNYNILKVIWDELTEWKIKNENFDISSYIVSVVCPYLHSIDKNFPIYIQDEFLKFKIGLEWEELCVLVSKELYGDNVIQHPLLPNRKIPDIGVNKKGDKYKIIIECKKSDYFIKKLNEIELDFNLSSDFQNYHEYCNELEFWVLDDSEIIRTVEIPVKVKVLFSKDLMKKRLSQDIKTKIKELREKSNKNLDEYHWEWIKENNILYRIREFLDINYFK